MQCFDDELAPTHKYRFCKPTGAFGWSFKTMLNGQPLWIDFVSDVCCPWCAIGLASLQQALANLHGEVTAQIHFEPFALNPQMLPEGENATEHLMCKYGITAARRRRSTPTARRSARREALGVAFRMDRHSRVYNTFDAHRLLHWAKLEDRHVALKRRQPPEAFEQALRQLAAAA